MHGVGGHNGRLLQRHGSLPRQLDDILGVNPDRRPVGQARTQAGPPFKLAQTSHFTAVFAASTGLAPIKRAKMLVLGVFSAIWMTPYGQFSSQLPHRCRSRQ